MTLRDVMFPKFMFTDSEGSHSKFKLYWINFKIAELTYPATTNPSPPRSLTAFAFELSHLIHK